MKKINLSVAILVVLGVYFSCANPSNSKKNTDHYRFDRIEKINSLNEMSLKLKRNKILVAPDHPKITAPLRYKDDNSKLNFNNTYRLTAKNGKSYLFRFSWISYKNDQNTLSGVVWIQEKPSEDGSYKNYQVETVKIPFEQRGDLKLCTIGDSQTWWKHSGKLRFILNKTNPDFYFVGSNTDRFGYPNEGEGGNSTKQVMQRIEKIPQADYYSLLLGTNDWKKGLDQAFENIQKIVTYLLEKFPESKILYLTPLPSTNKIRDDFNTKLAKRLKLVFNKKKRVIVIDLGDEFRENPDWAADYLLPDGLHPSRNGVELMAKTIGHYFKITPSSN